MLKHLALTLLGLVAFSAVGQTDYTITNGTVNTCDGIFHDDGGPGGGPYTATDYTFTICPDIPGNVVQVDFLAFQLWTSPNPNNSDRIFIFDGPDAGAPNLGSYTGNQLQGLQVTATINNPSGCLTFFFDTNPNTAGTFPGWEANIICTTPCATPTAASEISEPIPSGQEQSVGACIGDPITFSDNGSFAEPGFNLETYYWNFGDGTIDTTSGPEVTHAYDEPGEYITTLTVIDDNGCASLNLDPLQVLISTIPVFNVEFDDQICLGGTSSVSADPESTTWTALPPQVVAGETFLADGAGFSYSTSLTFDFFEPGAVLEDCDDLLGVFVNMEHSYLGDLGMQLECPDGTVVNIIEWPNGGGGTYLGEAVDDGEDLPGQNVPGVGYTYTWAPGANNGNLSDQPQNTVDYTTTTGFPESNDIVPEGTYQADGDLCDFVGCPLNGSWTFTVTDNLGIDNGFIFFWGLDLNPAYYPDVTTFTPVIGMDADSSFWSGTDLTVISDDGNQVEFMPSDTGSFELTFSAQNNFGCLQDTTIIIDVVPGPEADAGPDLVICEDSLQMAGSVAGTLPPPPNCDYTLEMFDSFGDGWNGFTVTVVEDGNTIGTYQVDFGSEQTATIPVTHGATIELNTASGTFDNEVSYTLLNAAGEVVFESNPPNAIGNNIFSTVVDCQPESPDYVYEWSPTDGLSNPNIADPMVMVEQNTTYTMTVWEAGFPECATTDEVEVTIPPEADPGEDNEITLCFNDPVFAMVDSLLGTPADTGEWTDEQGNVVDPDFNPSDYEDGGTFTYTYTVTFGPCVKESELIINVLEAGNVNCCQTFADAGADGVACDLTWELNAQPVLGIGTWSSADSVVFADINNPNTTVTAPSPGGVIELYWTDNNGLLCDETDTVEVAFMDPVSGELTTTPATCPDSCNGIATVVPSGGLGEMSIAWSTGFPGASDDQRIALCEGSITVYLEDEFGCTDSTVAEVAELPTPLIENVIASNATCYGWCDGALEVIAPEAVSFSFDGGATFQAEAIADSLCAGDFTIEIRNDVNCPNFTSGFVDEPIQVEAEFAMSPSPTNWNNTTVTFNSLSYPEPFVIYDWTFDTLNLLGTASGKRVEFTFPDTEAGTYPVQLCVENEAGCADCVSYDLIVRETLSVFVPNTFTPNGDGINDLFKGYLSTENYSDFRMRIFNRQGELVFETSDPEEGWNGGFDDGEFFVPDEVYVYEITVTDDVIDETLEFTGHVTALR